MLVRGNFRVFQIALKELLIKTSKLIEIRSKALFSEESHSVTMLLF